MMLPIEILFVIFKHLRIEERIPLRLVCKSWNTLLFHPVVLRRLKFSAFDAWEPWFERYVDIALSFAADVRSLSFFQYECVSFWMSGRSLLDASENGKFKRLKYLSLIRTTLEDSVLITILQGTECLQHLHFVELTTQPCDDVATTIGKCAAHSLRYFTFPELWMRRTVDMVLDCCINLEFISIQHSQLNVYTMRAMLHRTKCENLKKVAITVDYERSVGIDDFLFRLMEDMDAAKASPVPCLCDTKITEHQRTLFKDLNILVCNCGVRFIDCYDT